MSNLYDPPDIFEKAANTLGGVSRGLENISGGASGLAAGSDPFNPARRTPTPDGNTTRQGQLLPKRVAVGKRQVMKFIIPEQPIVNMYVNPQEIKYNFSKKITNQRSKGGYIVQYWGEELSKLNVSGTTGTSGIEGINVLYDVYRNEQLMFDPYALLLQAERDRAEQASFDESLFGENGVLGFGNTLIGDIAGAGLDTLFGTQNQNIIKSRNKPTLAQLAFTVEIYWCGEVYRGYFENFNFSESVSRLGLFDYDFGFLVTQRRGFRTNFLGWHKDPNEGQSNWDPSGPRTSYSRLLGYSSVGTNSGVRRITDKNKDSINQARGNRSKISDPYDSL